MCLSPCVRKNLHHAIAARSSVARPCECQGHEGARRRVPQPIPADLSRKLVVFSARLVSATRLPRLLAVDVTEASWPKLPGHVGGGDRRGFEARISADNSLRKRVVFRHIRENGRLNATAAGHRHETGHARRIRTTHLSNLPSVLSAQTVALIGVRTMMPSQKNTNERSGRTRGQHRGRC